jgi:UDP-GlcNAc:undecaprenyl-phosphate GlcNAc-1-phosphate transferase
MTTSLILALVALLISLCVSLVATPLAQRIANRFLIVDFPDNHRKLHRGPIARCGGIAILTTLAICFLLILCLYPDKWSQFVQDWPEAVSLGIGSTAIVLLGIADDKFGLRGRQKLAGQILVCLSIIGFGFSIDQVQIFGWHIQLGLLTWPVTLLWLLLCINSTNLIDGADGLCSSIGWIAFAAVAAISIHTGNQTEGIISASMAGALLGFLFYNLPPAKVFLGDSGSMLIGLMLGVMTMRSWFSEDSPLSITIPVVLMSIPLFDSLIAILRRRLTGRSVFTTDRGHLHHNLMRHGIRNRALVGVITLLCLITAGGAVGGVIFKSDLLSISTMIVALGTLVATRLFGFAELSLLVKRLGSFAQTLIPTGRNKEVLVRQQVVQLQGSRDWCMVWETLVEFAERHGMSRVSLDLNMPWLHEGFHANWNRDRMPEYSERWLVRLPLFCHDRVLGRLEFIGRHGESETLELMSRISELLETLRPDLQKMIEGFATSQEGERTAGEDAAVLPRSIASVSPTSPPAPGVSA